MRLKKLVVRKHNGLIKVITEIRISCGYLAAIVIGKNAISLCDGFYRTDEMGYLGIKHLDFLSVCTSHRGGDFLGDVRAGHYHRHKYAVNPQMWIDLPFDFRHGAKQQL